MSKKWLKMTQKNTKNPRKSLKITKMAGFFRWIKKNRSFFPYSRLNRWYRPRYSANFCGISFCWWRNPRVPFQNCTWTLCRARCSLCRISVEDLRHSDVQAICWIHDNCYSLENVDVFHLKIGKCVLECDIPSFALCGPFSTWRDTIKSQKQHFRWNNAMKSFNVP